MVIKNSTPWRTNDLRKLFRRCVREVEKIEKPDYPFHKRNKHFKLDILNGQGLQGRATINGYWIMVRIPRHWIHKTEIPTEPDKIDDKGRFCFNAINSVMSWVCVKDKKEIKKYPHYWKVVGKKEELELKQKQGLAQLMTHEYYHTIGCKSHDRRNYQNDWTERMDYSWVKDYPIEIKEIVKKEKVDIKLIRYQRAIQNLRKAETRFKRARTIHLKWKNKVKYYQKVYNYN